MIRVCLVDDQTLVRQGIRSLLALDMLTAVAVGFAALTALSTGRGAFLDIALGVALINFIATAAFSVFLERKRKGP